MKVLAISLFFFSCFQGIGQINMDSLWQIWDNKSLEDTTRLEAIHCIAWDGLLFNNPDSSFKIAQIEYEYALEKDLKTHQAQALNTQGVTYYYRGDFTKAIDYYLRSLKIKEKINDKIGVASSYNNIGMVYKVLGDYPKSTEYYLQSLALFQEIEDKKGTSNVISNLGGIYYLQGDFLRAIDCFTQSLKLQEELGFKLGIAMSLNSLGAINVEQANYSKGIEYFQNSMKIREEINDKRGISGSLNNIGSAYAEQEEYLKALDFYKQSLQLREEIDDIQGVAGSLSNIASIYIEMRVYDEALDYCNRSIKIYEDIQDKQGVTTSLSILGNIYFKLDNYDKAIYYGKQALEQALEIGIADEIRETSYTLYKSYRKSKNTTQALEMYELYVEMRDSLLNETNTKAIIQQQFQYEYENKSAQDSLKNAEAQKLLSAEVKLQKVETDKQKQQSYYLLGGLSIALIFLGLLFNRFKVTNKQKGIIEEQKVEVDKAFNQLEEKNTEILDSINYAKRIQAAILPSNKIVKEYLQNSFILYKPKDIVAGDFYWMERVSNVTARVPIAIGTKQSHTNDKIVSDSSNHRNEGPVEQSRNVILFAAADCTGHGVPGAMVSVVCHNALNRAVKEFGLINPGEILDKTRDIVVEEFEKSDEEVKDGMDIALCNLSFLVPSSSLKKDNLTEEKQGTENEKQKTVAELQYAGANNPLWIVRNNEVLETKATKQPIGKFDKPMPFQTHTFDLQKGDVFYIFSDGYVDQFGGEKGKKFKSKAFKDLLLSIQYESMQRQKEIIDKTFENWRGDLEQIDDVCIIGVKV